MEKQEIIKEISNENVLSGYDEDSTIIEIDKAIEFLNNKKVLTVRAAMWARPRRRSSLTTEANRAQGLR